MRKRGKRYRKEEKRTLLDPKSLESGPMGTLEQRKWAKEEAWVQFTSQLYSCS